MVELAKDGYPGPFVPIMLSALAELKIVRRNRDKFNWSNVSDTDPRIELSEWLKANMKGTWLSIFIEK